MGMFDEIVCEYQLPVEGFESRVFQTKNTPVQFCDRYLISKDGFLFHYAYDSEEYEAEDEEPQFLKGFKRQRKINERLEQVNFSGLLEFHDVVDSENIAGWISFEALFDHGKVLWIECAANER